MHESVKSRSSTPQLEYLKTGQSDVLQLLQKWNLMELQKTFKDHDITLRSLMYLNEADINELIPKIGLRTIFRALLQEWRETQCNTGNAYSQVQSSYLDNESFLEQIELKTECNSEDLERDTTDQALSERSFNSEYQHQVQDENNNDRIHVLQADPKYKQAKQTFSKTYQGERFIVVDILKRYTEGQAILEFYKTNQFLDIKNRKRIVNILIREVVESKVAKYTAIFHDMARQLIELFPTEKYETYFVPHSGSQSARGALYYRYSNYTRQLRKEGLLAYKKSKPRTVTK
ncbi:uncharacterized protein LOC101889534 [Musca domestica]|uniref:Uncharacterized protein LOC101889534 n=1 Tax=Musca domestica TaxID=7370 RepID=A0ABM3V9M4_MUSDO|nr:uncharacterized protein LOC101889534 [Musca domestica]